VPPITIRDIKHHEVIVRFENKHGAKAHFSYIHGRRFFFCSELLLRLARNGCYGKSYPFAVHTETARSAVGKGGEWLSPGSIFRM